MIHNNYPSTNAQSCTAFESMEISDVNINPVRQRAVVKLEVPDIRGYTALQYAAALGNDQIMNQYLEVPNINIDVRDQKQGLTPLMFAVQNGHEHAVLSLIEQGANPNLQDFSGRCCLYIAIQSNNLSMANLLIENGAQLNLCDMENVSPLHIASAMGNNAMVRALLHGGAWVNLKDNQGETPLFYSIREGKQEVTKTLVEAGADINITSLDEETPCDFALSIGDHATYHYLSGIKQNNNSGGLNFVCGRQSTFSLPSIIGNESTSVTISQNTLVTSFTRMSLEKEKSSKIMEQALLNKWVVW